MKTESERRDVRGDKIPRNRQGEKGRVEQKWKNAIKTRKLENDGYDR